MEKGMRGEREVFAQTNERGEEGIYHAQLLHFRDIKYALQYTHLTDPRA